MAINSDDESGTRWVPRRPDADGPPWTTTGRTWLPNSNPVPEPSRHTNGFAVAALILGLLCLVPFAVVFGVIALVQIRDRKQSGAGLAVGGLVASGVWVAIIGIGLGTGVIHVDWRDSDDDVPYWLEGTWAALRDGDCVDGLSAIEGDTSSEFDFPVVPCSGPHEGEVYATFELAEGAYPGLGVVAERADERCELLLDNPPETIRGPEYGYLYLYPHDDWWPEIRTVVCIAFDLDGIEMPAPAPTQL